MSSRSWLSYSYQSRFHLTPLSYETLEYASGFASEQCPEGIVAISTNTLRYGYCKYTYIVIVLLSHECIVKNVNTIISAVQWRLVVLLYL